MCRALPLGRPAPVLPSFRPPARPSARQEAKEDAAEESGWKLCHGDVFRPPARFGTLAVYVGTGAQVFGMTFVTMLFALLGFLSPANRGGLMTAMLFLYVFMGERERESARREHSPPRVARRAQHAEKGGSAQSTLRRASRAARRSAQNRQGQRAYY